MVLEPFEDTRGLYGRLLAYVYVEAEKGDTDTDETTGLSSEEAGGTPAVQGVRMLNEELIRRGYGYADDRFRHMFRDRFDKLQKEAQAERRELWEKVKP